MYTGGSYSTRSRVNVKMEEYGSVIFWVKLLKGFVIAKNVKVLVVTNLKLKKEKTVEHNMIVIGDIHEPFTHRGYLAFCLGLKLQYRPTTVILIGDLVDNHGISYHEKDPDGYSPGNEAKIVDKKLKKWYKAFPKAKLCLGNHDLLVERKAKTHGLPTRAFKNFREIWKIPDTWDVGLSFEVDSVLFTHGTNYSGKYPHVHAAADNRQSTVIGHCHGVAGVEYSANEKDCIFGMSVGCGIDRHSYAMAYGKGFRRKPILGAGVIHVGTNGTKATFIPMQLGDKNETSR